MSYNTEQKKAIQAFLCANSDRQFTVEEIAQALGGEAGVSTVYRRMPALVKEGGVKRFVKEGSRKAVYQAVNGTHCAAHLHMKCIGCGRLLHMDDALSERVIDIVERNSAFSVIEEDTVLFGKCADCKK